MLEKISSLGKTLGIKEQRNIRGGKTQDPVTPPEEGDPVPDGMIKCYCDGRFAGHNPSIESCLNFCNYYTNHGN